MADDGDRGSLLDGVSQCRVDFDLVVGFHNDDGQSEMPSCGLHLVDIRLHNSLVLRVRQQNKLSDCRKKRAQQRQSLLTQFTASYLSPQRLMLEKEQKLLAGSFNYLISDA